MKQSRMTTMYLACLAGASLVSGACATNDGGSEGPLSLEGSIGGVDPDFVDVIAYNDGEYLVLRFTDYADACKLKIAGDQKQNSAYLSMHVFSPYPGKPGTVSIGGMSGGGDAYFKKLDATCNKTSDTAFGSFTETEISANTISGTLDLTFPDGRLTGRFDAQICGGGVVLMPPDSQRCIP